MEKEKGQCVKVKIFAMYYDMYHQSRVKLASTIICSDDVRPYDPKLQYVTANRSIYEKANEFTSQYYDEARKCESIPTISYEINFIKSIPK